MKVKHNLLAKLYKLMKSLLDLIMGSTRGGIRDRPRSFLLDVKFSSLK